MWQELSGQRIGFVRSAISFALAIVFHLLLAVLWYIAIYPVEERMVLPRQSPVVNCRLGATFQPPPAIDVPIVCPAPEVQLPVIMKKVEPIYPRISNIRIAGITILEAVITAEGIVENIEILKSSHPKLDAAAVNAVRLWRYKPAMLNGYPIAVHFTVTVNFHPR